MKRKQIIASGLSLSLLLMSGCSEVGKETGEHVDTGISTNVLDAVVEGVEALEEATDEKAEVVESKFNYDQEWEIFKEAVLNKDLKGISAFAGSDEIDAQIVIDLFADSDFSEQLKKATYNDLTSNAEGLLEFSATVHGSDDEGNEYESGIYLYFSQGESLKLENIFAAG